MRFVIPVFLLPLGALAAPVCLPPTGSLLPLTQDLRALDKHGKARNFKAKVHKARLLKCDDTACLMWLSEDGKTAPTEVKLVNAVVQSHFDLPPCPTPKPERTEGLQIPVVANQPKPHVPSIPNKGVLKAVERLPGQVIGLTRSSGMAPHPLTAMDRVMESPTQPDAGVEFEIDPED